MKAAVLRELGKAPKYEEFAEPVAGEERAGPAAGVGCRRDDTACARNGCVG
jgi:hypothetical protein